MSFFACTAARRGAPAAAPAIPVLEALDERPEEPSAGPGWYESSWDLRCGLEVREAPWSEAMTAWPAAA